MFDLVCVPLWCNPTGPGMPFGTWYLIVFDLLRVFSVVACLYLVNLIVTAWHRSWPHGGQRDRYLALGLFAFIVIGTELNNLGNIMSYRLVLSLIAVLLAIRGLRKFAYETPSKP